MRMPPPSNTAAHQSIRSKVGARTHRKSFIRPGSVIVASAIGLSVTICLFAQYHLHPSKSTAANPLRIGSEHVDRPATGTTKHSRALRQSPLPRQRHDESSDNREVAKASVGVAVTITGCDNFLPDGAAVLQYSILRRQRPTSPYRYDFYAIYHPSARACAEPLADLNFTLMERESPVLPQEIRGRSLRDMISTSGCCGEKELLKFEAFTLTQHDAVVLLDMDTMVAKPLDDAIDLLLRGRLSHSSLLMYPERQVPDDIWIMYTPDLAMVPPEQTLKPTQGGFAILKPNQTIYDDIVAIVREGNFDGENGWLAQNGESTGWYYGVQTFQGLVPFYFGVLDGGRHAVELSWCRFNSMNVQPSWPFPVPGTNTTKETCYTNQETCEDCRKLAFDEIFSFHATICQKYWHCEPIELHPKPDDKYRLCYESHRLWFDFRSEMERSWGRSGRGDAQAEKFVAQYHGYCHGFGGGGYEPIKLPFGRPAVEPPGTVVEAK